jgi:hypothetical protein
MNLWDGLHRKNPRLPMSVSSHRDSVFDGIVNTPKARKSVIGSVLSASSTVNVRAVVRLRPPTKRELDHSEQNCVVVEGNIVTIAPPGGDSDKAKTYSYDKVYQETTKQEELYRYTGRLVEVSVVFAN